MARSAGLVNTEKRRKMGGEHKQAKKRGGKKKPTVGIVKGKGVVQALLKAHIANVVWSAGVHGRHGQHGLTKIDRATAIAIECAKVLWRERERGRRRR